MKPGEIRTSITCEILPNIRVEVASQSVQIQNESIKFADRVDRDGDGYVNILERDYYYLKFSGDITQKTMAFIDGLYGQSQCTDDEGKKIELISVKAP